MSKVFLAETLFLSEMPNASTEKDFYVKLVHRVKILGVDEIKSTDYKYTDYAYRGRPLGAG
ncbi:hypothetical protein PX52LOC_06422 [Limnoglobus roseus]|uniref:Uncharacterized protein n=1 Tax=Limnoglobus roseus TaxID=2598579 RepID=A0A5C1AML9_9BACT|nr:hypothetical protein PX52LOC_06422 [Limnoglobus roseus]